MDIKYIQFDYESQMQNLFKLLDTSIIDFEEDIKILKRLIMKGIKYEQMNNTKVILSSDQ